MALTVLFFPLLDQLCTLLLDCSLYIARMTKNMTYSNFSHAPHEDISMLMPQPPLLAETRLKDRYRLTRVLVFYILDPARQASVPVPVC